MIAVDEIQYALKDYFKIDGSYTIDPHTHLVSVNGHVSLVKVTNHIPVKFDHVSGDFYCNDRNLTSLVGSPRYVGGSFVCGFNQLKGLTGAPVHVGGDFLFTRNPLESLERAPDHVGGQFFFTWNYKLPLLRCLRYKKIKMNVAPDEPKQILNKYAGQGKAAALNCALELKKAGYPENARW